MKLAIFSWPVFRRRKTWNQSPCLDSKYFYKMGSIATAEQTHLFTNAKYFSRFKLEVTFFFPKKKK